jgi:hypothetical protein
LFFQARISVAERALHALSVGLRVSSREAILLAAIDARTEIRACHRAARQLVESEYRDRAMLALRSRGHDVLAPYLGYMDPRAIAFAFDATAAEATKVALVAMLWKVSEALDGEPEALLA